jgi:hypothetical protein
MFYWIEPRPAARNAARNRFLQFAAAIFCMPLFLFPLQRAQGSRPPRLHLATSLPVRRIEFRIGKFGLPDFLDFNAWGTDSHLQFLNWTVDNNGAYGRPV